MTATFASVFFSVCGVSNSDHLSFLLFVLHSSLAIFIFFSPSTCARSVTRGPIASIDLFEEPFAVKGIAGDVTVKGKFMRRGCPCSLHCVSQQRGLKKDGRRLLRALQENFHRRVTICMLLHAHLTWFYLLILHPLSPSLCLTLYNGGLTSSWQRFGSVSSEVLCKLTAERREIGHFSLIFI